MIKSFTATFLCLLLSATMCYSADTKGSDLPVITPVGTDTIIVIDDPGGTPATSQATIDSVIALLSTQFTPENNTIAGFNSSGVAVTYGTGDTLPFGFDIYQSDGTITFGGVDGTNNEDLTNDFETTANTVGVSSSTGVTTVDYGSIGITTSGTITGAVNTPTYAISTALTAANASGSFILATAAMTLTLPTAAAGYSGCLVAGQGVTAIIQLTPAAGDYLVVDGVRGTAATAYASAGAAGDKICFISANADDWYITSTSGTWSE